MRHSVRTLLTIAALGLATVGAGCSVRGVATSVPSRIFREVHALRVRSYQIKPVAEDLRPYKAIEIRNLDNLMLDEIHAQSVAELNTRIVKQIRTLNRFEHVTVADRAGDVPEKQTKQAGDEVAVAEPELTLVVEGYIDDYTPGIPKLRYIEQGNNHAVLTVRITLKDKQTGRVLGQINITVENARITSNLERMVDKSAEEVATYVRRSATRRDETKGAIANAQK